MAERRMFAKTIIDSDMFLDMPLTTQALYFHMAMRADDDGFVNNPKKIIRMIGAEDDSLKLLIAKKFIIPFESGIVVIRHWRVHNYIQKDRYKETVYEQEQALLRLDNNHVYNMDTPCIHDVSDMDTSRIHTVSKLDTQVRLGKDRLGKDRLESIGDDSAAKPQNPPPPSRTKFKKPSLEEVRAYCEERRNGIDPQRFIDYYDSNGWKVGKNPMKDWKATIRNWETRNRSSAPAPRQAPQSRPEPQTDSSLDVDEWERMAQEFDPQMLLDDLENFEEGGQLHDL